MADASGLPAVAPELLEIICEYLDFSALKELRLSCKHLGFALLPRVLRSITIDVNQSTCETEVAKLRAMASGDSGSSVATNELTIRGLSPTYRPWHQYRLKECLFKALTSFKNVRTITWNPQRHDKDWAHTIVMSALKTLPSLQTLTINATYCKIPLKLNKISGLSTISLKNVDADFSDKTLEAVAKMVANSPQLTSIDLLSGLSSRKSRSYKHSLHYLLKHYPKDAAPLRLHHLGLDGCYLRLDSTTLPHLRSLKSLRITRIIDPYAPSHGSLGGNIDGTNQLKQVGSSYEDLWKIMENKGIWLEKIDHDDVCPEFQQYLATYSSLKILRLIPDTRYKGATYLKEQSKHFFGDSGPLLRHSQNLEELIIKPRYEGGWCFDMYSSSESLSACVKLRRLGICVLAHQVLHQQEEYTTDMLHIDDLSVSSYSNEAGPKRLAMENAIRSLLDTVIPRMPNLEALKIFSAPSEYSRTAWCGTGMLDRTHVVQSEMMQTATSYIAPASIKRLPSLAIQTGNYDSDTVFIAKRNVDDAGENLGLMYVKFDS